MLRGIPLVVLALSIAVVAGYIEVYVENGPDLDGLHIYAWDGKEWVPVGVTYVPEYIDTYITAVGQWAQMPYYNMSRYILHIPREAFRRGPPHTPPGLDKWTLEVQNGTRKAVVELAVGRTPIAKGNLTLTTWYALGDQPPKTPYRGRFINPPRSPPKNNEAAGEAGTASYAVSPGTTIYPIGSLYFKPVRVRSGWFSTYVPVDTPIGYNIICTGLPEMHWVGFEVQNFTVGVKVSGTIYYGTLTLEFYNINHDRTCTLITTYTIQLPSSGRWANIDVQLPRDSQIGVRIRVYGYASSDAIINVSAVARYVKTVNSLAQIATTKAVAGGPAVSSGYRDRIAVLFGPYVAYDGLAATSAGTSFSYINVPSQTVRLRWYGQYCPLLIVYYYVNGIAYTTRFVGPSTSSPVNYYCNYDVPSTVLQLWARGYAISKALSKGGGITVSTAYDVLRSPDVSISFNGLLQIVYDRWIEPFHSRYMDSAGDPYDEWGNMLLLNTYQVLGPINATTINIVSEIRTASTQLALSLAHNQLDSLLGICGAEWVITAPVVGSPSVFYGNEAVDEQWWAAMGSRVLDAADWFLTLYGLVSSSGYGAMASILVKVVYNIFQTASASVSVTSSNGVYTITWKKGWAESPPPTVVILLYRQSSSTPQYAEWKYFAEGYPTSPWTCAIAAPRVVNTNMYLPTDGTIQWSFAKIWTWRGQTRVATDVLNVGSR